jgi:hypothetical protein
LRCLSFSIGAANLKSATGNDSGPYPTGEVLQNAQNNKNVDLQQNLNSVLFRAASPMPGGPVTWRP